MKSLTKDELARLLSVIKGENREHYLAALLSFNHGLRVGELTDLRTGQIKDGFVTVERLKGSLKTTQALIGDEKELLSLQFGKGDRVFSFGIRWFQKLMHRYGEKAGIPYHKATPHKLKHTCAMLGLAGGMKINEVQIRLGHKSLASTGAYLKLSDEEGDRAFEKALTNSSD
jgi:integrase